MTRPARVAYVIASHGHPHQLRRFVAALRAESPRAIILIHHDRFAAASPAPELIGIDAVHIIESPERVRWGGYEMVDMWLRCFDALRDLGLEYDWVHLTSAQDYPIRPLAHFEAMLAQTSHDGFLRAHRWDARRTEANLTRYYFQYRQIPNIPVHWRIREAFNVLQPLLRFHANRLGTFIGTRALNPPFTEDMPCYWASFWMTLNEKSVAAIRRAYDRVPGIADYYRQTLHSDESCLQTLLIADRSLNLRLDSDLHHVNWRPEFGAESPGIFVADDYDEITASPAYFARKFDVRLDSKILDRLDARREALRSADFEAQSS